MGELERPNDPFAYQRGDVVQLYDGEWATVVRLLVGDCYEVRGDDGEIVRVRGGEILGRRGKVT